MTETQNTATIVGAGLVGSMLSITLAEHGIATTIYERRSDMRRADIVAGRSINLVATSRGMAALNAVGLGEAVRAVSPPVAGRIIHAIDSGLTYQPYGKDASDVNYSVSRGELNKILMTRAEELGATIHFEHKLVGLDAERGMLEFDVDTRRATVGPTRVFGADGAFSNVRSELARQDAVISSFTDLGHGYKELFIPPAEDGGYLIDEKALHIWPRGRIMLMALPNPGGSFTVTLYMPQSGVDPSFASVDGAEAVMALFEEQFPDAVELLPTLGADYVDNPTGQLGTQRCAPWHFSDRVALVGDAAHAIVPFFGQGMNCGFEDCSIFSGLMGEYGSDWGALFSRYSSRRKANAEAIADMSIENFYEMSEHVADPGFILRKRVENRLENAFPLEFRSRYSMVAYSRIPYAVAQGAGQIIREQIISPLVNGIDSPDDVDLDHAHRLIRSHLSPYLAEQQASLDF